MHAFPGKCVQEDWQGRHESLSLSGCHLRNLALMKDYSTDQLDIVVDHVPGNLVAAGHPVVVPYGIVTVYLDEVPAGAELTVKISGLYADGRVLLEPARCGLHYGKSLRQNLIQDLLNILVHLLDELVGLCRKSLFLVQRDILLKLFLDLGNAFLVFRYPLTDDTPQFG